jgi:hypothetical protein
MSATVVFPTIFFQTLFHSSFSMVNLTVPSQTTSNSFTNTKNHNIGFNKTTFL